MKRTSILMLLVILISPALFALTGEITFVVGTVDFRSAGGPLQYADFGMSVREGDSIITGLDGQAEIALPNGSVVRIEPDTVFTYQRASVASDREPENVFDVMRGQVAFRFNQLGSDEPSIRSRSVIAGVRGTEFTVIAGADGQSLFVVSDGAVAVQADGREVELGSNEAVEVSLENGVGEKFPALDGEVDFSSWRNQADMNASENPVETLNAMTALMLEFLDAAESYRGIFDAAYERQTEMGNEIAALREEAKEAEIQAIRDGEYASNSLLLSQAGLNYRYYALSVQSLRRFIVSDLYVQQRLKDWDTMQDDEFFNRYENFTEIYENRAVPFFVEADI